jgi:hypothetical protein
MTLTCTRQLLAAFSNAPSRLISVAPADVGMQRIGHLGAFKSAGTQQLWARLASAIDAAPAEH